MAIALAAPFAGSILARGAQILGSRAGVIGASGAAGATGAGIAGSLTGGNGHAQQDVDGFVYSRRNVRVMVNPATGQVILVPAPQKKGRRRYSRRMSQVERDLLRSAADLNRTTSFAVVASALRSGN